MKPWEIIKISSKCLLCSKKFDWWEEVIVKTPDWACFCYSCIEKIDDQNEYDMDNGEWWVVVEAWQPDLELEYMEAEIELILDE